MMIFQFNSNISNYELYYVATNVLYHYVSLSKCRIRLDEGCCVNFHIKNSGRN